MKPFWLVYCPTGPTPPRFEHMSKAGASAEAKRLASVNRGHRFFVVEVIGGFVADDITTLRIDKGGEQGAELDEDIPF